MSGTRNTDEPRILVVGYHAWDLIMPVDSFPEPDGKKAVPWMLSCGGGPGATAAVALARLGASVRFLSPLTDDEPGRRQRQELLDAGVDVSLCPVAPGRQSPRAVILVDRKPGQRTIFWTRGDLPHLAPSLADGIVMGDFDLLYVDGHEPDVSIPLAKAARASGLPVVMDAGSVRRGSRELVGLCSDVIGSAGFAPDLTGLSGPVAALRALREMGPDRVGMTCGADGVLGLDGEKLLAIPAFEVPVVDTTGAGDAFHAGYAYACAVGRRFRECLDWGCAVAGLKCGDWGGRRALPDRDSVEDLLSGGSRVSGDPLQARLEST